MSWSVHYSPPTNPFLDPPDRIFVSGLESAKSALNVADNLMEEFPDEVETAWVEED